MEENSPIGLVVARITATDPDEGPNAQIMYQIVEGNIPEVFQLDIFSGELTALADLDYEAKAEYVMVVQATSAPLVSRATVHVRLRDANDNSPQLRNFEIVFNNYITNRSGSFPGGVIGRIPARDPDVSDSLTYSFEQGNELNLVLLDPRTGDLRLSPALDNNRPLEAVMRVSVSGKDPLMGRFWGVPSRSGDALMAFCPSRPTTGPRAVGVSAPPVSSPPGGPGGVQYLHAWIFVVRVYGVVAWVWGSQGLVCVFGGGVLVGSCTWVGVPAARVCLLGRFRLQGGIGGCCSEVGGSDSKGVEGVAPGPPQGQGGKLSHCASWSSDPPTCWHRAGAPGGSASLLELCLAWG